MTRKANRTGVFSSRVKTRLGRNKRGFVKATYRANDSLAFSLKPVPDRIVNPFGKPGNG